MKPIIVSCVAWCFCRCKFELWLPSHHIAMGALRLTGRFRGFFRSRSYNEAILFSSYNLRRELSSFSGDDSRLPVLIIGAGPVGLVLSILLTKLGSLSHPHLFAVQHWSFSYVLSEKDVCNLFVYYCFFPTPVIWLISAMNLILCQFFNFSFVMIFGRGEMRGSGEK